WVAEIYAVLRSVCLVRAAFCAARLRPALPLVRTAFSAAKCRALAPRVRAELRAWRDTLVFDAAECPSRFKGFEIARERVADGLWPGCFPALRSCSAFSRTCSEELPSPGGGSLTPARRAFERPIAMACLVERAPCFPSRM